MRLFFRLEIQLFFNFLTKSFHKFLNTLKVAHILSFIFYNYQIKVYYNKESTMKYRTEFDSIGKIKVPGDKYWGASTERSNKYFNIGDFLVRPLVIHSIAIIKKAAAIVNTKNKDLDKKLSKYIIRASEEVIKGKHDSHFPLKFGRLDQEPKQI